MRLFHENAEGVMELIPEAKMIAPFKRLITRDKGSEGDVDGRKKYQAMKELAFVYWYAAFDSNFHQYDDLTKIVKIKQSLKLDDKWRVDKDVQEAIDCFTELQNTKSMVFLQSVEKAVEQLAGYLLNTDIDERIAGGPHNGELVHDMNKYKNLAKEMPDLLESYAKAKEIVKKELQESATIRGNRKINKYNS